jgi:hypothetical protein
MWIYTPRRVQNLERFRAADPWNGNQEIMFSLDRVFIRSLVPDRTNLEEESKPHKYALRSELDRHHRTLPDSLASLWRDGKVAAARLPALLNGLEPNLRRSDYIKLLSMTRLQRAIRTYAPPVLGALVVLVGLALWFDDPSSGAVMMAIGILIAVLATTTIRRLNARRKQQIEWALNQSVARLA